jgi:hypothetical protein
VRDLSPVQQLAFGIVVLTAVVALLTISYVRGRRVRLQEEAARRARLVREEEDERAEETHRATLLAARERARIAYPDLLDAAEADAVDRDKQGLLRLPAVDEDLVRNALGIIAEEQAANRRPGDPRFGDTAQRNRWQDLEFQRHLLESIHDDPPTYRRPSRCLQHPQRIIDCGNAGKVELFSIEQVTRAREESGFTRYISFLEDRHDAPQVASDIIERARREAERT